MKVEWYADEVAGVICDCGARIHAHEDGTTCEDCGRRYSVIQMVHVEMPIGRCAGPDCDKWLYGSQRKKKQYCSEECGVKARKAKNG